MKKYLKIAALILALVLIAGVGWFANALVGNPLSKALVRYRAEQRLGAVYSDLDVYIDRVNYSFKDGNYHVHVKSDTSMDTHFSISYDLLGRLGYDSFEDYVASGWNTADRITTAYRGMCDEVLQSPAFPFECHIDYGDIEFTQDRFRDNPDTPEYAMLMENLEMDRLYDIRELGAKAGHLVIYIDTQPVNVEHAAEILLEIREVFDQAGVPFRAIDLVLRYPKSEEGGYRNEDRVDLKNFLYEDIHEEGILERITQCAEATQEYYDSMDK